MWSNFPFLFLVCTPAISLVLPKAVVDEQLVQAILVVDLEIVRIESISDPDYFASTLASARIEKIVSQKDDGGWFPSVGETIQIQSIGGEKADRGVFLSGFARPYKGRHRAHLMRLGNSLFGIAGFEHGLVPLHGIRNFSRNRTDGSDGSGNGPFLYWEDAVFPIPYFISLPTFERQPTFVAAVHESFRTWRAPGDVKVEFLGLGCSNATQNENDGINNVIFVTQNWPFEPSVIAVTRNFYVSSASSSSGLILDSDILLNAVNHSFTTIDEPGSYDMQNIVTHEIGHLLGLGHEINPVDLDATMFTFATPNETKKRFLHPSDLLGLRSAYGGVGKKTEPVAIGCEVVRESVGCSRVHKSNRKSSPHLMVFIFIVLLLGRRLAKQLTVSGSRAAI